MSEPGTFFHLHEEDPVEAYENFKLGMWIFLATEVLLFGGLFAAYFIFKFIWPTVFEDGSSHLNKFMGGLNTLVLIFSSFSTNGLMSSASQKERNSGDRPQTTGMMLFFWPSRWRATSFSYTTARRT